MPRELAGSTRLRRLELPRLLGGSLLETFVKAYGGAAALAVAFSDAESAGGKARDAIAAVPTLTEEYRRARYVSEHREEIQASIDYLNAHQVPEAELQRTLDESGRTLDRIGTTYDELDQARDSTGQFGDSFFDDRNPFDGFGNGGDAAEHLRNAWEARPSLDSIQQLQETAEKAGPLLDQANVLAPVYYSGAMSLADNFASDEIASTLTVIALALVVSFLVARSLGFWVRRGRPGLVAFLLHGLGARAFPRWYARNAPYSMSRPLYATTRGYVQRELVDDPEAALDEDEFRRLEEYFAARAGRSG